MKYRSDKNSPIETLIGEDVHIVGDVTCEKAIRIEGKLEGNITSKNKVIIGTKAQIVGDIQAKSVVLYGKVEGNINTQENLEVMETGELYGELNVVQLYVALGGVVCGQSHMKKNEPPKKHLEKSN